MSYESRMLEQLAMPTRTQVGRGLLRTLLKHGGVVKEFGAGEQVVDEIADQFRLNKGQRTAALETIYRKENRLKKALLWHRLLFRAADSLANEGFVTRPTQTYRLTQKREWTLTERGFDEAQKVVKKLIETRRPQNYQPFDTNRKLIKTVRDYGSSSRLSSSCD